MAVFTHDAVNDCPEVFISNGESAEIDVPEGSGAAAIISDTYSPQPTITGGTTYWVGVISKGGHFPSRFNDGSGAAVFYQGVNYSWPTATQWEAHIDQTHDYSFYVVYTEAGGASVIILRRRRS